MNGAIAPRTLARPRAVGTGTAGTRATARTVGTAGSGLLAAGRAGPS
jgi:hypothetical protein